MEELIKRLERVIQTGAPDKDGQHPISAETVLEVVKGLSGPGTNLAEAGTDVPNINVGELISKQQAIDYFVTNVGFHDEDGYPIEDTDELRKIWTEYFDGIPSAQPKRGRWIGKYPVTSVCSECGFLIHDSKVKAFAFCPNCGADMREETT